MEHSIGRRRRRGGARVSLTNTPAFHCLCTSFPSFLSCAPNGGGAVRAWVVELWGRLPSPPRFRDWK